MRKERKVGKAERRREATPQRLAVTPLGRLSDCDSSETRSFRCHLEREAGQEGVPRRALESFRVPQCLAWYIRLALLPSAQRFGSGMVSWWMKVPE